MLNCAKITWMNMQKYYFLLAIAIILVFGAGCNPFANNDPQPETQPQEEQTTANDVDYGDSQMAEDTALSNPATVYCLNRNGEFEMKKTLAGTTEGYCTLPDGTICEVWALYKGKCGELKELEEEISTSTDDIIEDETESATGTAMDNETSAENRHGESEDVNENENDNEDSTADKSSQSSEKKKKTGKIDIAVKPGEEAGEIYMSWDTHELEAPDGYIVMLSGDEDLSYPTQYYHELSREESYSFTWIDLNPEKEYYFRVCIKQNDDCKTYSPIISTYPRSEEEDE